MRLLICDGHVLLADTLATLLKAEGHAVQLSPDPGSIMAEVDRWRPEVLVLDVSSVHGEPMDVVSQVATFYPDVRVIVLSSCREPAVVSAALRGGARGYLGKHVEVPVIVNAVERVHAGERVLDTGTGRPELVPAPAAPDRDSATGSVSWLLGFLTPKEHEVLRRIVVGESTREMAESMHVSRSTARTHVQNVLSKLGVHSRLEAAAVVSRARGAERAAMAFAQ